MNVPPSSIEDINSKVWFKSLRSQTKVFLDEELAEFGTDSKVFHRFQDIKCPLSTILSEEAVFFEKKILHANRVKMIDRLFSLSCFLRQKQYDIIV